MLSSPPFSFRFPVKSWQIVPCWQIGQCEMSSSYFWKTNKQTNNAPSFVILPRPSLLSGEVHTGLSEAQLLHVYVFSSHAWLSMIFTLDDFWIFLSKSVKPFITPGEPSTYLPFLLWGLVGHMPNQPLPHPMSISFFFFFFGSFFRSWGPNPGPCAS